MAKLGYVSHDRAQAAMRSGLGLDVSGDYFKHRQPYFFDYVENELISKYGVNTVRRGGLEVQTTIDPDLQRVGLEAMRSALPYSTDPSSALVSIDPRNGQIRAMVSSSNYAETQFNLAAQGRRQPGSTFKAFVLTTAIKQGIDPYTTYYTSKPLDLNLPKWGHWTVHTADEGYQGTINLQQATVTSDNTVFAQLDLDVGPESVAQTAKSMGITTPLDGIPAEGIGGLRLGVTPLELTDAYATLASGGIHHDPVSIEKVTFPDGKVDHPQGAEPKRVLPEPVAYEVTKLLHDNITEGTGTAAYTGCAGQAGKTGTTDEYTDAWFSGYQPNLATAVWVGYPESNDDLDVQRARDHRLRRHLPGRNLALALLRRRRALRGIRATRQVDQLGPLLRPVHPVGPGATAPARAAATLATATGQRRSRRLRPERIRPRRLRARSRPGTGTATPAALPSVSGWRRREPPAAVAEHLAGGCLWSDVGGLRGLPGRAGRRPQARPARRLGAILLAVAAFAVAPVLLSHDVYSYLDYARLGVVHGLDPYVHPPLAAPADPAFAHVTWTDRPAPTARCSRSRPIRSPGCRSGSRSPSSRRSPRSRSSASPCSSPASPPGAARTHFAPLPSSPSTRSSSSTSSAAPTTTAWRCCWRCSGSPPSSAPASSPAEPPSSPPRHQGFRPLRRPLRRSRHRKAAADGP